MKKTSYKVSVQRVLYSYLEEVVNSTSPFPRRFECLCVSVIKGKKVVKEYFVEGCAYSDCASFDAFIGKLYRGLITDLVFPSELRILYVVGHAPSYDNEIENAPCQLTASEFFDALFSDYHIIYS